MEFNIKDLNEEQLERVKRALLLVCQDYEPWADMMNLGGAGDPGSENFPFNIDDLETITIDVKKRPQ